ncbi:MAG: seryl-tRNA synthetase [Microgenomates group bacterium Gr01-1014_5]|nr:MAG: seryl-tRNA synthetase [Microgenomates group bacterium Gr01-1014_5]
MIDIQLIRNNSEKVKESVRKKGYDTGLVDKVLEADKARRELIVKVDALRKERNEIASAEQRTKDIEQRGREIKEELKTLEPQLKELEEQFENALGQIPNLPSDKAPTGKGEEDNKEVSVWGEPDKAKSKDHLEIGKSLGIIDFEAGSKVTGSGFYYLKGDGALLELALAQYGLKFLNERGFTPVITPDLAQKRFYEGTGYLPKGDEAQTYVVNDNDLGLVATAEVTLAGYHADEVLNSKELPKKYAGYSHCFRMESGAYGKYSKGLYRVHQFSKVEMFAFTKAEESESMHEGFLKLEEEFWQSLGIPYRVIEMCTGDLGAQAARKFDLEAWMPGRGDYGEITSTSNTTDYQARNLNIKYREGDETKFAHTINGTLVATPRAIIAILENGLQEDGSVVIPEVLRPYMGKDRITSSR